MNEIKMSFSCMEIKMSFSCMEISIVFSCMKMIFLHDIIMPRFLMHGTSRTGDKINGVLYQADGFVGPTIRG